MAGQRPSPSAWRPRCRCAPIRDTSRAAPPRALGRVEKRPSLRSNLLSRPTSSFPPSPAAYSQRERSVRQIQAPPVGENRAPARAAWAACWCSLSILGSRSSRWPKPVALVRTAMSRSAFAEFIESGLESAREFFSRSSAPVMEEDHSGAVSGHVMVNGNHVETVLAKSFQNRRHFLFEHRDVTRDRRVFLRADKRGPRVQSHAGVDHSPVLLHTRSSRPTVILYTAP